MNLYQSLEKPSSQDLSSISAVIKDDIIRCAVVQSNGALYSIDQIDGDDLDNAEKIKKTLSFIKRISTQYNLNSCSLALDSHLFTLIPTELYNEDEDITYFRNIGYLTYNDQIVKSDLPELKSQYLYGIRRPQMDDIKNSLPNVSIFHYGYVILKDFISIRQSYDWDNCLMSYVSEDSIYLGVFKNKQLQLFNKYPIETSEDFLYYILLCISTYSLDRDNDPLVICGSLLIDSEMIALLSKYIKHVEMVDKPWGKYIQDLDRLEHPQFYQDLYALSTCA